MSHENTAKEVCQKYMLGNCKVCSYKISCQIAHTDRENGRNAELNRHILSEESIEHLIHKRRMIKTILETQKFSNKNINSFIEKGLIDRETAEKIIKQVNFTQEHFNTLASKYPSIILFLFKREYALIEPFITKDVISNLFFNSDEDNKKFFEENIQYSAQYLSLFNKTDEIYKAFEEAFLFKADSSDSLLYFNLCLY